MDGVEEVLGVGYWVLGKNNPTPKTKNYQEKK